jgi:hypothetical protein
MLIGFINFEKIWLHDNEDMEVFVTVDEAESYIRYGWELGRIRECCGQCGKRFNKSHCKNHEVRCKKRLKRKLKKLKKLLVTK